MKRLILSALVLTTLLIPHVVFSEETQNAWYTDVEDHNVYKDAITYMTDSGFVHGYDAGNFQPMKEINRVEALKTIIESSGEELTPIEERELKEFPDIDPTQWYYEYFEQAYLAGIVDGHEDGFFRPENTINRAEALKMIAQVYKLELEEAQEEQPWYQKYIDFGGENALIIPVTANSEESESQWDYLPGNALTRGELCDMIYRYQMKPYTGEIEYGVASYYGYGLNGANTASGTPLDTYGYMTAHKTLPFGSWIRVTNLDTNLSVDVIVVDRGPYVEGRVVDLTPAAFEAIGSLSSGVIHTRVEVLTSQE